MVAEVEGEGRREKDEERKRGRRGGEREGEREREREGVPMRPKSRARPISERATAASTELRSDSWKTGKARERLCFMARVTS